jgi:hypothetical protein
VHAGSPIGSRAEDLDVTGVDTEEPRMNHEERALKVVVELLKILPAVAGVMLGLVWGLAGDSTQSDVLDKIRIASIILAVSVFFALLGLQFVVSALQAGHSSISSRGSVQFCFFVAWVAFLAGCVFVVISLYSI